MRQRFLIRKQVAVNIKGGRTITCDAYKLPSMNILMIVLIKEEYVLRKMSHETPMKPRKFGIFKNKQNRIEIFPP